MDWIDALIAEGTISVGDDVRFRTHVEVARLFGKQYAGHQQATIHLDEQTDVWFPKLHSNPDWENSLSADGTEIRMRPTADGRYGKVMDEPRSREYVITFAKNSRHEGYAFIGVFQVDQRRTTTQVWVHQRVSTSISFDGTEQGFSFTSHRLRREQDDQVAEAADPDPAERLEYQQQLADGDFTVEDRTATTTSRGSAQAVFAHRVKSNYGWECAVTGIRTRAFLVASHIVPWAEDETIRLDPSNGICLSTFVDRAFDAGFLTITPEGRTAVRWDEVVDDAILSADLRRIDDVELARPSASPPDPEKLVRRLDLAY